MEMDGHEVIRMRAPRVASRNDDEDSCQMLGGQLPINAPTTRSMDGSTTSFTHYANMALFLSTSSQSFDSPNRFSKDAERSKGSTFNLAKKHRGLSRIVCIYAKME